MTTTPTPGTTWLSDAPIPTYLFLPVRETSDNVAAGVLLPLDATLQEWVGRLLHLCRATQAQWGPTLVSLTVLAPASYFTTHDYSEPWHAATCVVPPYHTRYVPVSVITDTGTYQQEVCLVTGAAVLPEFGVIQTNDQLCQALLEVEPTGEMVFVAEHFSGAERESTTTLPWKVLAALFAQVLPLVSDNLGESR